MGFPSCNPGSAGVYCPRHAGVMELADVTDSKLCSPHAVRTLKAFEIQGFPEMKNPPKPAPTSKSTSKPQIAFKALSRKHLCRRDGIGRRVGLKIQWANHPCGFDPRRRHHPKVPKALILKVTEKRHVFRKKACLFSVYSKKTMMKQA